MKVNEEEKFCVSGAALKPDDMFKLSKAIYIHLPVFTMFS